MVDAAAGGIAPEGQDADVESAGRDRLQGSGRRSAPAQESGNGSEKYGASSGTARNWNVRNMPGLLMGTRRII